MTATWAGLTVRWSLAEAPDGVEEALADYVADASHARFTGMAGLRFSTQASATWLGAALCLCAIVSRSEPARARLPAASGNHGMKPTPCSLQ